MAVRIKLTDAVAVDVDGVALEESKLGGRQPRLLLAVLVLERNRSLPRSHLAQVLWPDELPPSWEAALRGLISKVRAALAAVGFSPSEVLTVAFGCYQLHLPLDTEVDIEAARSALEAAERAMGRGAADEACRAASVAREVGSRLFFVEHEGVWVDEVREHLRSVRLRALEILSEALASRGEAVLAIEAAEEAVRVEPLRESGHRCLMAAHTAAGNRGKALRAYERCRRLLADELGVDPSAETEAAYVALLGSEATAPPRVPLDEVGHPFPEGLPEARRFLGRQVELRRLREIEVQARSGRRQLVLVGGEAGMGKTAFAAEIARSAHQAGAAVLHGRCDKLLVPYEAFRDAFTRYLRGCTDDEVRTILQRAGPPIDLLVPETAERWPEMADRTGGEPDRHRLLTAAVAFLRAISETAPVVLVLDDLHRAGAAELLLLRFVVRALESAPILIVATYRSDELGTDETGELIAQLRQESAAHLLLDGLDLDAVKLLVTSQGWHLGREDDLPRRLWESTGGNPFFIGELLVHLSGSGPSDTRPRRPAVGGLPIPASVTEVINQRRSRLSDHATRFLSVASVVGNRLELGVLERACEMDPETFVDALDEVVSAKLLDEVAGATGLYQFRHDMVREVTYSELGVARRCRLHARVGEALETIAALDGDVDERLTDLAFHFNEAYPPGLAGAGDGAAKALEYSLRAGARAMEQLAYNVAEVHYERALQRGLKAAGNEVLRCRTLMDLAVARRRAGRIDEARDSYMAAVAGARRIREPAALAVCAIELAGAGSPVSGWIGDEVRISLLHEALEALDEDGGSELRTEVLAGLTAALQRAERYKQMDSLARDALTAAHALDEPPALVAALGANQTTLWGPGNTELRVAYADEMVTLAGRSGDLELCLRARLARLPDVLELGQRPKFDDDIEHSLRLASALGDPAFSWRALIWDALRSMVDGELADAELKGQAALAAADDRARPDVVRCLSIQRATLHLLRGRPGEGLLEMRSHPDAPHLAPCERCLLALVLAADGQRRAAAEEVERFAAGGWVEPPFDSDWLFGMAMLAEASAKIGDVDKAEVLYALLLPFADRMVVLEASGGGASFWGSVSHPLGILAATMGKRTEAERHLNEALQANDRWGAKPLVGRTRGALARVRLAAPIEPSSRQATG